MNERVVNKEMWCGGVSRSQLKEENRKMSGSLGWVGLKLLEEWRRRWFDLIDWLIN